MEKLCLCLIFAVVLVFIQLKSNGTSVEAGDTLSLGASLSANQTIISRNGTFELGFFSPNGSNWYIGIWYANIPENTYVWVANRENPARNRSGVLKLSRDGRNLVLFDAEGASIWSVNTTKKASRAVILDTGNFLMLSDGNKSEAVWQSFDNPVDTLLPGMTYGGQQKLTSWKNSLDPAPGLFSFGMDPSGARQYVLTWNNSIKYWDTGIWDGKVYSGIPEMADKHFANSSFISNSSGLYSTYTLTDPNVLARIVLTRLGQLQESSFDGSNWSMFWAVPRDACAVYGPCGAYGTCDSRNLQLCTCVQGFKPADNHAWVSKDWASTGCARENPLNCTMDEFIDLGVTLPNEYASSSYSAASTKDDCQRACLRNCSCTAFSFSPCRIWYGELLNMRSSTPSKTDSNVFIRASASQLPPTRRKSTNVVGIALGIVLGALTVALGIFLILVWWRRKLRCMNRSADSPDSFLRMFTYKELKVATRNFKSKLGSGGFGSVFKGSLPEGTLVAVKKMKGSRQSEKQFRAEICSLGNIQHVNLVRLRGFCAQGFNRLLVYDYMPNGSLNSFLFRSNSKGKQKRLDWKTRFEIALGTARALLYLHEECRDCIIHCDVKPENILLDNNYSPKLADFGLSKLVGRDMTSRVLTTTRGTRGYLAPEWISGLPITPKVDVYSFGMTLLEIISGRRNVDLNVQDSSMYYFPAWAANQIHQGNTNSIVEEGAAETADMDEVRRACIVALLCIEKDEEVRPSMIQVVQMLEGRMELPSSPLMLPHADQSDIDSSCY